MGNQSLGLDILLLILLICQMLFGCSGKAYSNISCIRSERRALLHFKKGLIDKANRLSSWKGENCCKWEGIGCNIHTGRVEKLNLHHPIALDEDRYILDENYSSYYDNLRLGGEISHSLFHLEYLEHLDLSWNNFTTIGIPTFFGSFKYMTYLNLSNAQFHGEIPSHLGNLSRLQHIDLGGEEMFGILSVESLWWITRLSSLKSLDLSYVDLGEADDWLQAISMLPSLQSLNLASCYLPGVPPISHVNMTSLVSIDLSENYLHPSFPLWLFNLSSVENINLRQNKFQDKIPNLFERLRFLATLDLSSNSFSNTSIPNSLCTLSSLTHIDLSWNSFQDTLPLCLENLTSLSVLRLASNEFQGTIPFQIGLLGKLIELDLSENKLEGPIHSSLGQLTELQSLHLSSNSFVGDLTELHFARLTKLKSLDISRTSLRVNVSSEWFPPFQLLEISMDGTPLGPRFPPWLETQKGVSTLRISNASISDTIPNWFEVVYSHIQILDLSVNQISGNPPEILGSPFGRRIDLGLNKFQGPLNKIPIYFETVIMKKNSITGQIPSVDGNGTYPLRCLVLNGNNFTGNVPSDICNLRNLAILDLSENNLSGEIPFCLGNLQYLQLLNLAKNSLSGQIPGSLGNLVELVALLLSENNFHGELPSSMRNLTNLRVLDLGQNQLSSTLPSWFGKGLPELQWLRLESNGFYGDIPVELCQLQSLGMLNLAQNSLTGVIPPCFGNFSAMVELSPSWTVSVFDYNSTIFAHFLLSNFIKGRELMYAVGELSPILIALSENKIVGEIPKELTDLVGLHGLNLSKNHLHGRIPENIGNLKNLESLDLSMNELSGLIPPSLATIDTLGYMNLSYNKLSGQIPQSNHFQTFDDKSIYEGNRGLCGKPLPNCPDDKPSREAGPLNLYHGESSYISWFYAGIGPGFAAGFVGVITVLRFKKSWRHAYFKYVENICSDMWMRIVVKFSLLWRKFKGVNA